VDVSALGTVHKLNLSFCTELKDVSALGAVPILNLTRCPRILDFSAVPHALGLVQRFSTI